ncbi:MAG TPA: Gfo/Idh/MocA family oxidoreductase [Bryobacteraceae bacterium]|nr:Gfo/Idh/MocA family oxidoreductase [Bryobacteraceae bacterium]
MRVAVLGLGFMGSTHLRALRGVARASLAAIYSSDERKLAGDLTGIQGNLGGPGEKYDFSAVKKYRDLEPLLADPEIDAVDICLPTHQHAAVAIEALRNGKHVLVEKPMALDGSHADAMIAEAQKQGRVLMTAQVLRFLPMYAALRDALRDGSLGSVRHATFRRRCAAPAWSQWLGDSAKSGGGVFDLLIHDVDMCLHLFGMPAFVSATGYAAPASGVDVITGELHYPGLGTAVVTGGWHHPKTYPFSMEYTVVADRGTVEYSSMGTPPTLYRDDGAVEPLPMPEKDGYQAEIEHFIDCCDSGRMPELCPPAESAAAVKLTRLMVEARNENGGRIPCTIWTHVKSA